MQALPGTPGPADHGHDQDQPTHDHGQIKGQHHPAIVAADPGDQGHDQDVGQEQPLRPAPGAIEKGQQHQEKQGGAHQADGEDVPTEQLEPDQGGGDKDVEITQGIGDAA